MILKRGKKGAKKVAEKSKDAFQKPSVFTSGNVADDEKNVRKDWVF